MIDDRDFRFAILDAAGNPQTCDVHAWIKWFSEHADPAERRVAFNQVGDCEVSTVFVGCGLTMFETAIFNAEGENVYEQRCDSRAEAVSNHAFAKGLPGIKVDPL